MVPVWVLFPLSFTFIEDPEHAVLLNVADKSLIQHEWNMRIRSTHNRDAVIHTGLISYSKTIRPGQAWSCETFLFLRTCEMIYLPPSISQTRSKHVFIPPLLLLAQPSLLRPLLPIALIPFSLLRRLCLCDSHDIHFLGILTLS